MFNSLPINKSFLVDSGTGTVLGARKPDNRFFLFFETYFGISIKKNCKKHSKVNFEAPKCGKKQNFLFLFLGFVFVFSFLSSFLFVVCWFSMGLVSFLLAV